jgi:glutathione S-transferase
LELYHNNMSTCAQKVRLVLKEKSLAVQEHHLNLRAGDQNTPQYLQLNPQGVVPTLVDRGTPIVESTIICEYLEDAYPEVPLRPEDPLQRARMRWWTHQPDAGFHHSVGQTCVAIAFRHQMMAGGPEKTAQLVNARKDPVARERLRLMLDRGIEAPGVADAIRHYYQFIGTLEEQLQRTAWLAGDHYSLADAMALPYVVRLEHLSYEWWWTDPSRERKALAQWLSRCKARPSYSAIADYLDPAYLELMPKKGAEVRAQVESILALK